MKNLPLLFVFLFVCSSFPSNAASCSLNQFIRYQQCAGQILNHLIFRSQISSSCCSAITDADSCHCPTLLPPNWFLQGRQSCTKDASPPPPEAPATPSTPPPSEPEEPSTPPSDPEEPSVPSPEEPSAPSPEEPPSEPSTPSKGCPLQSLRPFYPQMIGHYRGACPLSSACCAAVLKLCDDCTTFKWSPLLKHTIDECKRQKDSPAPPSG